MRADHGPKPIDHHTYVKTINRFPPVTREVFLMDRIERLSYREIANRLMISESAVQDFLCEALIMLHAVFHGEGEQPRRFESRLIEQAEAALAARRRLGWRSKLSLRLRFLWGISGSAE